MEMECNVNGQSENAYEIPQNASGPPAVPKQDNNERLKNIFPALPNIGYRKCPTLRDRLVRAKLKPESSRENKSLSDINSRITQNVFDIRMFRASNNLFYKRFPDSVNYATANAQCEGMGARLISTGMRCSKVKNEIFPKHYLTGASSWIGLEDISNEGIWVWSDGVNETPSVIWAPGQPNGGRTENCAGVTNNSIIVANDARCLNVHRFVCKRELE
ncbi:lectin-like [Styela clava]